MKQPPPGRAAVFLDRDGTLNREVHFLRRPEELELIPGAAAIVAELNRRRVPVIVVTNQSGIARGYLTEETLVEIHARLESLLEAEGAHVDAIYHCPHYPGDAKEGGEPETRPCACRKPAPGMLLRAAADMGLDLERSVIVGDSLRDLEAGERVGSRGVLVLTGKGTEVLRDLRERKAVIPTYVSDLSQALDELPRKP